MRRVVLEGVGAAVAVRARFARVGPVLRLGVVRELIVVVVVVRAVRRAVAVAIARRNGGRGGRGGALRATAWFNRRRTGRQDQRRLRLLRLRPEDLREDADLEARRLLATRTVVIK